MAKSEQRSGRPLGPAVKIILPLAAIAFVGLLLALYLANGSNSLNDQWRQAALMCLVATAALGLLLVGLARTGSNVLARAVIGGVLCGVSATINASLALALFDYHVTSDLILALRMLPVALFVAPVGA